MNSEQKDFLRVPPPASLDALENGVRSEPSFINERQLLARLPVSRRTLFNWRTTGKIPCVRWVDAESFSIGQVSRPRFCVTSAAGSRDIARLVKRQKSFATPAVAVLD